MNSDLDLTQLKSWVGRRQEQVDVTAPGPIAKLMATLDRDDPVPVPGDPAPPLAHWLYFLSHSRNSELGSDGHDARGGFLPPIPFPRRMWAGGRIEFLQPLRVGERIRKVSEITELSFKEGRSGPLVFVTVHHEISGEDGTAIREDQNIVYREDAAASSRLASPSARPPVSSPPPPDAGAGTGRFGDAPWRRRVLPDPVMLFRYSALTFNSHRIHYDHPYATGEEGYPGLVVHGPLTATLLLDLCRRELPDAGIAVFDYKASRPLFAGSPVILTGTPSPDGSKAALQALNADGAIAMAATAEFRA